MDARLLQRQIESRLTPVAGDSARFEAQQLIKQFCGVTPPFFAQAEYTRELEQAVARRERGEPLQYILGEWEFYGRRILIEQGVFIPRPETELLAALAVEYIKSRAIKGASVLELCCGSGAAGLTVAAECADVFAVLADLSGKALELAAKNAALFGVSDRTEFVRADALKPLSFGRLFDVVLCNPPYIPARDIAGLCETVREFEPETALTDGADGLTFYRALAENARAALKKDGVIAFEVGAGQAQEVARMLRRGGFKDVAARNDYQGIARVVSARA